MPKLYEINLIFVAIIKSTLDLINYINWCVWFNQTFTIYIEQINNEWLKCGRKYITKIQQMIFSDIEKSEWKKYDRKNKKINSYRETYSRDGQIEKYGHRPQNQSDKK